MECRLHAICLVKHSIIFILALSAASSAFAEDGGIVIQLSPRDCEGPGRTVPNGKRPTPQDLARDAYCAELIMKRAAPNGVVTVFGSARLDKGDPSYALVYEFANKWTKEAGDRWPIATGGGQGIMKAANEGAKDAKGKSIGLTCHFGRDNNPERPNDSVTDGYTFSSFSQREAELIDRANAVVIAAGGLGTEWEIFETLSKIQTEKNKKVPVILLGPKDEWKAVLKRLNQMVKRGVVSAEDVKLFRIAETADEAIRLIKAVPGEWDAAYPKDRKRPGKKSQVIPGH